METLEQLRSLMGEVLRLGTRTSRLDRSTGLLGNIPEFDSIAVVSLLMAIEERFGIALDDDEISAEIFESVGSLCDFAEGKLNPEQSAPGVPKD